MAGTLRCARPTSYAPWSRRAAALRKRHDASMCIRVALDDFAYRPFQGRQLERLAQDHEAPFSGLHHVAVARGEQHGNLRIAIADLMRERDAVHAARHHDI